MLRRAATPTTGSPSESSCTPNCLMSTLTGNSGRIGCGAPVSGGGVSEGSGRRRNCICPIVSWSTSSRWLNKASRFQISRTLSTLSHGPWRSERTMSLMVASEDSTPSTAPMDTLSDGDDKAREIKSASTPLSLSAAKARPQSASNAISAKTFRRRRSCAINPTDLILRSRAERGVSKDEPAERRLRLPERPSRPLRGASGRGGWESRCAIRRTARC